MNNFGMDPRMDPRAAYFHAQRLQMMQQQPGMSPNHMHPGMPPHPGGFASPQAGGGGPQPGGGSPQKSGEGDQEIVARNLLNLKTDGPEGGNGDRAPTEEELRQMQAQRVAMMRGGAPGMFGSPAVGQVYGYPTVSAFDRHMIAAAVNRDNHRGDANMLAEPQISLTDVSFDDLIGDSTLVVKKDRDLVPDALFVCMAQMKPCRLTQADRVGCYKARELGFVGMCCKHCNGQPGFGRYFPNSVRSLAQTTTSQTILKHIGGKCRFCPPTIRKAVLELQRQQAHKEGMASGRPRYGSRKIFFQRLWARLHGKQGEEEADEEGIPAKDEEKTGDDAKKEDGDEKASEEAGDTAKDETKDEEKDNTDAVKDDVAEDVKVAEI